MMPVLASPLMLPMLLAAFTLGGQHTAAGN